MAMRELFQIWTSGLTTAQTDRICDAARAQPATDATIFSAAEDTTSIRSSTIRWLPDDWVRDLLWDYVKQANDKSFGLDVDNHAELQFTEYHADAGGHYDWHHDVHWNGQTDLDRKISVTVQLSDSLDYGGGDFEFDEIKTTADFRSKGTVLVFPSVLRHRVLPVTSGTRRSLVAWFFGPRWR
jgi:PKHD-type hydroxylase